MDRQDRKRKHTSDDQTTKDQLTKDQIDFILVLIGHFKTDRRKKSSSEDDYQLRLRGKAKSIMKDWLSNGVPNTIWEKLKTSGSKLLSNFNLVAKQEEDEGTNVIPLPSTSSASPTILVDTHTRAGQMVYFIIS